MAFTHGKKSVFKFDNGSGTLAAISQYLDNVQYPTKLAADEVTAQGGSTDKAFIQGLRERTISLTGKYDAALGTQVEAVLVALASGTLASALYEWDPAGTATGTPKFTGNCVVTDWEITAPVGGAVTFKLDLQVTGNHTVGAN